MTAREALAWAAGFFDGEGNINVRRPKGHAYLRVTVQINQAEPELLERFKAAVGGLGNVRGPYDGTKAGWTTGYYYRYECQGINDIKCMIALLFPFLGSQKQKQAEIAWCAIEGRGGTT